MTPRARRVDSASAESNPIRGVRGPDRAKRVYGRPKPHQKKPRHGGHTSPSGRNHVVSCVASRRVRRVSAAQGGVPSPCTSREVMAVLNMQGEIEPKMHPCGTKGREIVGSCVSEGSLPALFPHTLKELVSVRMRVVYARTAETATHTPTHTGTHADTPRRTHRRTHRRTPAPTHTPTHTGIHAGTHRHTPSHTGTYTDAHRHPHGHTDTPRRTPARTPARSERTNDDADTAD